MATMKGIHFFGAFLHGAHFLFEGMVELEFYRVVFIGHRRIEDDYRLGNTLERMARDLIRSKEYVEFYIGRNGDFDILAASAVKRAQSAMGHENSSLILVQPYKMKQDNDYRKYYDDMMYPNPPSTHHKNAITLRNRWMVEQAHLLLACVNLNKAGGALTALRYAEKRGVPIINLI
ncbi:MAG: hypothetical protein IJX62_02495 [Clostridia bacterium]|nr:hypothetical protein [Clostridia bacterium]